MQLTIPSVLCVSDDFFHVYRTDFVKSSSGLERLNVSHNMLSEFDGDILSNNKRLITLDVSHNQIATLKLNEVNGDSKLFVYFLLSTAAKNAT